ncbi:MAG: hypothetical protein V3T70_08600 [Phycisphaerae bacterium]
MAEIVVQHFGPHVQLPEQPQAFQPSPVDPPLDRQKGLDHPQSKAETFGHPRQLVRDNARQAVVLFRRAFRFVAEHPVRE